MNSYILPTDTLNRNSVSKILSTFDAHVKQLMENEMNEKIHDERKIPKQRSIHLEHQQQQANTTTSSVDSPSPRRGTPKSDRVDSEILPETLPIRTGSATEWSSTVTQPRSRRNSIRYPLTSPPVSPTISVSASPVVDRRPVTIHRPQRVNDFSAKEAERTSARLQRHQLAVQEQQKAVSDLRTDVTNTIRRVKSVEEKRWGVDRDALAVLERKLAEHQSVSGDHDSTERKCISEDGEVEILGGLDVDRVLTRRNIKDQDARRLSGNQQRRRAQNEAREQALQKARADFEQKLKVPLKMPREEAEETIVPLQPCYDQLNERIANLEHQIHSNGGPYGEQDAEWARRLANWQVDWGTCPTTSDDGRDIFGEEIKATRAYSIATGPNPSKSTDAAHAQSRKYNAGLHDPSGRAGGEVSMKYAASRERTKSRETRSSRRRSLQNAQAAEETQSEKE